MGPRKQTLQTWLVPYVEGTLDTRRAAILSAHLASDPRLAAEAEALRTVTERLHQSAHASAPDTNPRLVGSPTPLWPAVEARLAAPRQMPQSRLAWAAGACAALLVLAALLLHGFGPRPQPQTVSTIAPTHMASKTVGIGTHPIKRRRPHGRARTQATVIVSRPMRRKLSPHWADKRPATGDSNFASPTPLPDVQAPAPRPAVSISDGETHFRLASPVRPAPPVPGNSPARAHPPAPDTAKPSPPPPSV